MINKLPHATKVEVRKALKALDSMYALLPKISCEAWNAKIQAIAVKAGFQDVGHLQRFAKEHNLGDNNNASHKDSD